MPPELPNNQHRTLRHHAIAVIERHQEDAMRQLRRDGVPEALALAVMQRIASLCLRTLRELDVLYREYEELVAQDGRSAAHQHWLHDKATGLLMQVEAGIAALVAEAITKAKEDYRQQLSQPREVISVPAKPSRPAWLAVFLTTGTLLVWLVGILAGGLLSYQGSGSIIWAGIGVLIPFVLWLMCGRRWWGLIFPLAGISLEAWALSWLYIVEGGSSMSAYDWNLSAGAPLCLFSDTFYRTVREAIFQQVTKDTTPEQWRAAQESLKRLREALVQDMPAMHYGALIGTHRCVNHLYKEATARLRSLEIMQPIPLPQPPPPPRETPADVVRDLRDAIQPTPEATTLGTNDPMGEERQPR